MGRDRTTTPEDDELVKLGEELVEWATEPAKELRFHINQWYCLKKGITKKEYDLMLQKPIFREYHAKARIAISARYVDGSINPTIASRFLRHYFEEVKQEENEKTKYDAETKANANIREAKEMNLVDLMKETSKGNIKQID